MSWLKDYVEIPDDVTVTEVSAALVRAGLEVTGIEQAGADIRGPIVVGRVLSAEPEEQKNGKVIHWCLVDVGEHNPDGARGRGIVCGADNFSVGDLVVVALPGAQLPGGFSIASRRTYGHISDGMMCAADELGLGEDHSGIIILRAEDEAPLVPGEDLVETLHLRDEVIDIDLTPDLGYCMSMRGVARELSQSLGLKFTDPVNSFGVVPHADGYAVDVATDRCPVFAAVSVTDVKPESSTPRFMQRRLSLAGMRPISLPVDIANYVMLETGQPLHTYDLDRVSGTIVVRLASEGEKLTTLDEQERTLSSDDIVIADDSGVIGLAGLMGGRSTEVTASTTKVLIEGAHFERASTQRSLNRHNLGSEASRRFARGVDPRAAFPAARRAADLLAKFGGGQRQTDDTYVGTEPVGSITRFSAELPGRVLGFDVARESVIDILSASGVEVTAFGDTLTVIPPSWRFDLADPYDYVEEIGRKRGFSELGGLLPIAPPGRGLTPSQRQRREVTHVLAAAGFNEVITLPFSGPADAPWRGDDAGLVRLANPLTSEQPFLRDSLIPGLLAALARNKMRSVDDVTLFEVGRVFAASRGGVAPSPQVDRRPDARTLDEIDAALPAHQWRAAVVATGEWSPRDGVRPSIPVSWSHVVDAALRVGEAYGVSLRRRAADVAPWHPGRCAELLVGDVVVGHAGELSPVVCDALSLLPRTCAAEVDIDALARLAPASGTIPALSGHAIVKEDVALVVDRHVPVGDVLETLREGGGELLESVRLFDVYTGDQMDPAKKSLAFSLVLRANDRTLTHHESAQVKEAAVRLAGDRHGAVQRDF